MWYVDGANPSPGGGRSPQRAFLKIQEGIDAASDWDKVIVAEGTYFENIDFDGRSIVLTSTDPTDPTVVANTIIDGSKSGSVVTFSGTEHKGCVLAGFTIRNGEAEAGGGICGGDRFLSTRAAVRNNVITGNAAYDGGGLVYCRGTISENTIIANSAERVGGGLRSCDCPIEKNVVSSNSAGFGGGGLYDCQGPIRDNIIRGNQSQSGGGVYHCHGVIENNDISGNSANYGGGLYYCNGAIQNNSISENTVIQDGGGLFWCSGTIANNVIMGNAAARRGGGLSCRGTIRNNLICGNCALEGGGLSGCGGNIFNNTICRNNAQYDGGGLQECRGTIQNCVIWGNTAGGAEKQIHLSDCPTFSCIQDWIHGGEGNITQDPQFVDADGTNNGAGEGGDGNYRLSFDSPCIDAGDDWLLGPPGLDLDGNLRIAFGRRSLTVDMGAYEYDSPPFAVTAITFKDGAGPRLIWNSQPKDAYTIWCWVDPLWGGWNLQAGIGSQGAVTSWTDSAPAIWKLYRVEMR